VTGTLFISDNNPAFIYLAQGWSICSVIVRVLIMAIR
jgi:hypothetical protein